MAVEGGPEAGQLDDVLNDGNGLLHRRKGTRENDPVAPKDDPDSEELMELLEVPVVDAREEERVDPLRVQAMLHHGGVAVGHARSA